MIGLRKYRGRLTEPLVRENGALRPASWDEALDCRGGRARPGPRAGRDALLRHVQLLQGVERGELPGAEVRPLGDGVEQHRLVQPHLTRPQRRRSGDGVRRGRRHVVL